MKKKIRFFSLFALFANTVAVQTVEFACDEAGNRISRTIMLTVFALRAGETDPDATPPLEPEFDVRKA
jgi:hypothetical protein